MAGFQAMGISLFTLALHRICIVLHFSFFCSLTRLHPPLVANKANLSKYVAYSGCDAHHVPLLFWRGKCSSPVHSEAANSSNMTYTVKLCHFPKCRSGWRSGTLHRLS